MRTVERFRPEHLERLIAQGVHHAQASQVSPDFLRDAQYVSAAGPAYTALDGDRIIGCSGVISGGSPLGTVWALVGEEASKHRLWLHRATLRYLDTVSLTLRLRRLEATVTDGALTSCRWLELLGFEFEGRMRNYGRMGETHLRYARIGAVR